MKDLDLEPFENEQPVALEGFGVWLGGLFWFGF